MLFNWFTKPDYQTQTTATDDMMLGNCQGPNVDTQSTITDEEALYTIGVTPSGSIQLRVNAPGGFPTSLLMNEAAVRALIRQLNSVLVTDVTPE